MVENKTTNELDFCFACDGRGYVDGGGEDDRHEHRIEEPP